MAQAKRTRDIPAWEAKKSEKKTKAARSADRRGKVKGKTFEDLTAKQKDDLLKELAVHAGLIEDSDEA